MPRPTDLIPGTATPEGTRRFRDRQTEIPPEHYREIDGLALSDLGIGTYLGEPDEATDRAYTEAVVRAVQRGVNSIDSAINYRFQRSERSIGEALRRLMSEGSARRDEIFVATKGGFVSFDGAPLRDPLEYLDKVFFEPGIVGPGDIVAGCHCMHPAYLRHEIEASRANLGLETIDLYYLHNPETQFEAVAREEFDRRLEAAFVELEKAVAEGKIARYGLATWDTFRVAEGKYNYLDLTRVLELAENAGGMDHHFRAVQLPFNLAYREAALYANQKVKGERVSFLRAAHERGIMVMASVPLFQGRLLGRLSPPIQSYFRESKTDAQRALAFAAAAPGMVSALAGMSRTAHVDENTEVLRLKRMDAVAWRTVIDNLS